MKCIEKAFNAHDTSLELHDVLGAAFCLAFIIQSIAATVTNAILAYGSDKGTIINIFDAQQFGIGCAAVVAAVGGAGWLKSRNTAPQPKLTDANDNKE